MGGASLHLYRQLTEIPADLQPTPANASPGKDRQDLQDRALATVEQLHSSPRLSDRSVTAQLSSQDLNAFFAYSLAWRIEDQGKRQIIRETHVEMAGETLKTTALLDLSQVSTTHLQGGDRLSILRRLLKIPGLSDRIIAVKVEGTPVVTDRSLGIQNPIVSLGSLRLSLPNAERWLGVSEVILQETLNKEWNNLPIMLEQVQIVPTSAAVHHLQLEGQLTAW